MLNKLMEMSQKREMRESRDEMVVGELVLAFAQLGMPAVRFAAGMGQQSVRFATPADPLLHSVAVTLDRKTGSGALSDSLVGSKAVITVVAEVKNYLADPDDLVNMWRTDFANIARLPMLGQVKLDHQLNSVLATKKLMIELNEFTRDPAAGRVQLNQLIASTLEEMRGHLAPYKKASPFEIDG
ncbi:MAG: hypothetical protein MUF83_11680 [Acidimicrobiales bacterium]|jgi:hypothetical protein|nr:hypothetical protein [Acidimicrobiales bacterium]